MKTRKILYPKWVIKTSLKQNQLETGEIQRYKKIHYMHIEKQIDIRYVSIVTKLVNDDFWEQVRLKYGLNGSYKYRLVN